MKVLFVCVENQMAEAFTNKYGKGKFAVSSAGNKPADRVNPVIVKAHEREKHRYLNEQTPIADFPYGSRCRLNRYHGLQ